MDPLEITRGPLLDAAVLLFLMGMAIRVARILARPREELVERYAKPPAVSILRSFLLWLVPSPRTWRRNPLVPVAGWLFHLGFFVTVLGAAGHGLVWGRYFGVSWAGLPAGVAFWSAAIAIAALAALVVNHLANPAMRVLGTPCHLLTHLMAALPLLTGLAMALGWLGPFRAALTIHILSAELLLVYVPMSPLSHLLLFFLTRTAWGLEAARRGVRP